MKHTLACDGLDPHIWRRFWTLLLDLEDDDNLVEEVHLKDNDTLNNMMMHDDLQACGDLSYLLEYDQTL